MLVIVGAPSTAVTAVALLLAGVRSFVDDVTTAAFDSVPEAAPATATVSVKTPLPTFIDAIEQDTVPAAPTAGVVHDWMYEKLATEYVLDETNQAFLRTSNPWALRGIVERLHEAAERGLWESPDPAIMAAMQQVYLEVEGDLEDGSGE